MTNTIHCSNLHHWRLDHFIVYTQYVVAAPPEPNFYIFTRAHTPFYLLFYFCLKEVVRLRLEIASILSCLEKIVLVETRMAAMIGIGRDTSI